MRFNKIVFFAVTLVLSLLCICSCGKDAVSGSDFARQFLNDIVALDFEAAYDKVSTSRVGKIDKEAFTALYTSLKDKLKINEITYEFKNVSEGSKVTLFSYSLTYKSELAGDITDDYIMEVLKDGRKNWYVNWTPALVLPEMEYGDVIYTTTLNPLRGEIIASNTALATNEYATAVSAVVEGKSHDELNTLADKICTLLPELKKDTVITEMGAPYNGVSLIGEYYPGSLPEATISALKQIEDVRVTESSYTSSRCYPYKSTLAHILGYVQSPTESEITELNEHLTDATWKYESVSNVGKVGLEKKYETQMRGTRGMSVYLRSAEGSRKRTLYTQPAKSGADVQLTIDLDLQLWTEDLLDTILGEKGRAGSVIVMNPNTGALQAIASYPTYDLNTFAAGISQQDYDNLMKSNAPLFNRALQAALPPGSTYKAITAAAALENNILTMDSVFPYESSIKKDTWRPGSDLGDWGTAAPIKRAEVIRRHSPLNMHNAMIHSDNIFFAYAALKLGEKRMIDFFNQMRLNEPIQFELSVEKSQYMNEQSSQERTMQLLADSGYGQATILVTPLQMAATYCAFANGGNIPIPYIVDGLYQPQEDEYKCCVSGRPAQYWKAGALNKSTCDTLLPALSDVMSSAKNGTGQKIGDTGACRVAGKTGTAEIGWEESKREIAWFIGFRTGVSEADARLVLVALELMADDEDMSMAKFTIARELLYLRKED